jgi:hypothetical protein
VGVNYSWFRELPFCRWAICGIACQDRAFNLPSRIELKADELRESPQILQKHHVNESFHCPTYSDNHEHTEEALVAMPHSTTERASSATRGVPTFKFPHETKPTALRTSMEQFPQLDTQQVQSPYLNNGNGFVNSPSPLDRWQSRRDSTLRGSSWANGQTTGGRAHGRQKSLSDAFKIIRNRRGSVSANVQEIGDALKAPVSPKLVVRKSPFFSKEPMLIVPPRSSVSFGTCRVP